MTDFRAGRRVKAPLGVRLWEKVSIGEACWEWQGAADPLGYGRIGIGDGRIALAHRVSFEFANGYLAPELCVLHKCDNPRCVRPSHLFTGSRADNNADKAAKGRCASGARMSAAIRAGYARKRAALCQ